MYVISKQYDLYINMYIYIYTYIHVFIFCLFVYMDAVLNPASCRKSRAGSSVLHGGLK